METTNLLLQNIDKIHTTTMGIDRIKKNLNLDVLDVVDYIKNIILDKDCIIYKKGKNYYCETTYAKNRIASCVKAWCFF